MSGYVQTVPMSALENKLGRKLGLNEEFETASGKWRVIAIAKHGEDTYTVEKIN